MAIGNNQKIGEDKYILVETGNLQYEINEYDSLTGVYVYATKDSKNSLDEIIASSNYNFQEITGTNYIIFDAGFPIDDFFSFKLIEPLEEATRQSSIVNISDITPVNLNAEFNNSIDYLKKLQDEMNKKELRIDGEEDVVMLPKLNTGEFWIKTDTGYRATNFEEFEEYIEEVYKNIFSVIGGVNPSLTFNGVTSNNGDYTLTDISAGDICSGLATQVGGMSPAGTYTVFNGGFVKIPIDSKDDQGDDFLIDTYYYNSTSVPGAFSKVKPVNFSYRRIFRCIEQDGEKWALMDMTPEDKLTPPVIQGGQKVYPTVADMAADTSIVLGEVLKVQGYYVVADGGGHERIAESSEGLDSVEINPGIYANTISRGYITTKQIGVFENTLESLTNEKFANVFDNSYYKIVLESDIKFSTDIYTLSDKVKKIHIDFNGFKATNDNTTLNFGIVQLDENTEYNIDLYKLENSSGVNQNILYVDNNISFRIKEVSIENNYLLNGFRCFWGNLIAPQKLIPLGIGAFQVIDDYGIDKVCIKNNNFEKGGYIQAFFISNIPTTKGTFSGNILSNMYNTPFGVNTKNDLSDIEDGSLNLYRELSNLNEFGLCENNTVKWDGQYVSDYNASYDIVFMWEGLDTIVRNNTVEGIVTEFAYGCLSYGQAIRDYKYYNNTVKNVFCIGNNSGYLYNVKTRCENIECYNNFLEYEDFIYDDFSIVPDDTVPIRLNTVTEPEGNRYKGIINNVVIKNNIIKAKKIGYYPGSRYYKDFIIEGNNVICEDATTLQNIVGLRSPIFVSDKSNFVVKNNYLNIKSSLETICSVECRTEDSEHHNAGEELVDFIIENNTIINKSGSSISISWDGGSDESPRLKKCYINNNLIDGGEGIVRLGNSNVYFVKNIKYDFIAKNNILYTSDNSTDTPIQFFYPLTTGVFEIDIELNYKTDRFYPSSLYMFRKTQFTENTEFEQNFRNKLIFNTEFVIGDYYKKIASLLEIETNATDMFLKIKDSGGGDVVFDYNDTTLNPSSSNNFNLENYKTPFDFLDTPTTFRHRIVAASNNLGYVINTSSPTEFDTYGLKKVVLKAGKILNDNSTI